MRILTRLTILRLLLISLVLCGSFALAQELPSIAGTVTDSKGVPIPGAGVCLLAGTNKLAEQLTDLDGSFKFEGVQPGAYQLTTEIVGFLKSTKEAVEVSTDSSSKLVVHMEPIPRPASPKVLPRASKQASEQTIIVSSFQSAAVTDLPGLNQFQSLSQEQEQTASAAGSGESVLFISGNTVNLDAGNMSDPDFRGPMMDAARQMGFQIQEFSPGGGGPGGGSGDMGGGGPGGGGAGGGPGGGGPGGGMGFAGMGRGGRGASFKQPIIEGSLTESYSNSALNARSYSLTGRTLDKPVQIGNNFSLTVGGAIPFLKSKTGTQRRSAMMGPVSQPGWSFTYSGNRNRSAMDMLTTVPTELERAGDFSQTYVQTLSTDAQTGRQTVVIQPVQLYSNPNDASSRFSKIAAMDPAAAQLLAFIPNANLPCASGAPCVNNYSSQRSLPTSSDEIQASVTGLRLTSKDSIGVNYSRRSSSSLSAATFPGLDTHRSNFGQNIGISGNHSFKSRLFANWRISLNRTRMESTNAFSYKNDVEGDLGITGVSRDPINYGPPTVNFSNYGSIALGNPSIARNQTLTVSGGITKMEGKHSFRAGIDANWAQRDSKTDSNGRGTFTFTGYATILLNSEGSQVSGTGNDFADFLLGLPYATSRRYVDSTVNPQGNGMYLRNRGWNLYVMDNWRVRSNLTLNYGLRYEYTGPSFEKYNRLVSLDANSDFSDLAQVFPNEKGPISGRYFSRSLVNPDRNNFAPRVGIAWKPKNGSPFVFRLGYGISYNPGSYSSIVGQLINQPPFAVTQDLASNRANPLTILNGFPSNPDLTILNTFGVDPGYKPSYAQQWSFDIQTQLSRLYVLNASYMGSKGTGLDIVRAPNRSSNAGFFTYETNGGSSIYHGLNVQLSRRFSRGFNMMNSYTFSKSIDSASGTGGSPVAQNDKNLAAERSLSSQDQRHNFQTNFTYELPIGQNRMFFAAASTKLLNIISGWTFNGNLTIAGGNPLNPRYASSSGSTSSAALYNALRPDATGEDISLPRDERTVRKFFNTAAFAIPAGEFGNAGRNIIPGPGSGTLNMSVRKGFRLDENNRRLDFSWQVQNLLNHPNWSGVSTTVNALNFGQVTGVRAMRSMTFDLRVRF
jgi:trimeric autotransporter adhesin